MKSNNQGVKDETFIHTSRRGGDGQLGQRGLEARQWLVDQQSHICMWLKQEEQLWSEIDCANQRSSTGK